MSPRPAAPSSASHSACSTTSPSECAKTPREWATRMPTSMTKSPGPKACTSNPEPILSSDPRSAARRIPHPRRGDPPHRVRAEPIEETPEVGGVETRPGGVVHEDPVARARAGSERLERPTHRVAAPLAALDGRHRARAGGGKTRRHFLPIRIIPRECHHELRAAAIAEKRRERPLDHRPAFEGRVLLAHTGAEAAA